MANTGFDENIGLMNLIQLAQQSFQPQGIETVNIGGKPIMVDSSRASRISNNLGNLANLGMNAMNYHSMLGKQQTFKQEMATALNEPDPQKQLQGIMRIGTKYGGFMGMDDQVKMYVDHLGKILTPQPYKPTTREEAVDFEKEKRGLKSTGNNLSPILQKNKDTRTEKLISLIEDSNLKRDMISEADAALERITSGVFGKYKKGMLKNIAPDSPMLGDWQKIKMVLTDAQLLNTAKTKGAISDREMALFADAAANDDLMSSPAVKSVFNKLIRLLDTEETASVKSFNKIYKEDPYSWEGVQSNIGKVKINQAKQSVFKSEADALSANLPKGTVVVINGRRARID